MSWIFEIEISGESISVQPLTSKTAIITNKISRSYTYMLFTAPNSILQTSPCWCKFYLMNETINGFFQVSDIQNTKAGTIFPSGSCMKWRYDLGGKNPKNYTE